MKLKIGAAVQPANRAYFEREIRPLLDHPLIEFVGEIGGSEKQEFIGNAYALLFPIDWPEPFGLVMIEAMACGTPVVAFARGSVPEVMWDGVSGFIVEDVPQAVEAVGKVSTLDRKRVRRCFDERFTVERMVDQYVSAYVRLLAEKRPRKDRSLVAVRMRRQSALRRLPRAHPAPPGVMDLHTDGVMAHRNAGTAEAAEE
jgi:glycosyltransferase involved in cell wall biosynthesis